jgi:hypothetical protein
MNYLHKGLFALAGIAASITMLGAPKASAVEYPTYSTPVFNTFTSTPYGDERDFVKIKSDNGGSYSNELTSCADGATATVAVYIHNNAASGYNGANNDGSAVATGTRLALVSNYGATGTTFNINGNLSASNAATASNGASINCADGEYELSYVSGSAKLYGIGQSGVALPDSVFTAGGASIGALAKNGVWPGCWEFIGAVQAQVKLVKKPAPVVKICVADKFIAAKINRTTFDSSAEAAVENAVVQSFVFTATDKNGAVVETKTVSTSANTASYRFVKDVAGDYTVSVVINTDKGVATGDCAKTITVTEVPTTPVYTCEGIVVAKIGDAKNRAVRVSVNTVAEPTNRVSVGTFVVNFGDGKADTSSADNTYAKDGTYNVVLKSLNFTVDGKTVTLGGDALAKCAVSITVSNVETCAIDASKPNDANCVACPYNGTILLGNANCAKPRLLPQTGAGSSIGVFIAASMVGMFGYRAYAARKMQ